MSTKIFQLSGFSRKEKCELIVKIKQLNGIICDNQHFNFEATHMISSYPSRSEKYLGALASGKWILNRRYIDESYQKESWLKEEKYEWSENFGYLVQEEDIISSLFAPKYWRLHFKKNSTGAFCGWKVGIFISDQKIKSVYERILIGGGATCIDIQVPIAKPVAVASQLTHVFVNRKDNEGVKALIQHGVMCLEPVYMGAFLLTDPPPNPREFSVGASVISSNMRTSNQESTNPQETSCNREAETDKESKKAATEQSGTTRQKRKLDDKSSLEDAVNTFKKLRKCRVSFTPFAFNTDFSKENFTETKKNLSVCTEISNNVQAFYSACIKEDKLFEALDTAQWFITKKRCPKAELLQNIMMDILMPSKSLLLSQKAYNVLQSMRNIHPPTTPTMKCIYLKSFKLKTGENGSEESEWNFIKKLLSIVLEQEKEVEEDDHQDECNAVHNAGLLLQYLVSLFTSSHAHYESNGMQGSLLYQVLWPAGNTGQVNLAVRSLFGFFIDAVQLQAEDQKKFEVLEAISCMLTITVEAALVTTNCSTLSLERLPIEAVLMGQELAYRIRGQVDDIKELTNLLSLLQPDWLQIIVNQTILNEYESPLCVINAPAGILDLSYIMHRYSYLVPPLTQKLIASPHKKAGLFLRDENKMQPMVVLSPLKTRTRSAALKNSSFSPNTSKKIVNHNINKKNMKGETQLHTACIKNNLAKVKNLLQTPGIIVNAQDNAGWTPLHEACNYGHIKIVQELLEYLPQKTIMSYFSPGQGNKKIDLHIAGNKGITALHDSVQNNHVDIVKLLLKHGGPTLLISKTDDAKDALDLAKTEEMKKILRSNMHSFDTSDKFSAGKFSVQKLSDDKYRDILGFGNMEKQASPTSCHIYLLHFLNLIKSYLTFYEISAMSSYLLGNYAISVPLCGLENLPVTFSETSKTESSVTTGKNDSMQELELSRRSARIKGRKQQFNTVESSGKENLSKTKKVAENLITKTAEPTEQLRNDLQVLHDMDLYVADIQKHLKAIGGACTLEYCSSLLESLELLGV